MMTPLLAAITAVSKEKGLSDADKSHLQRWASEDYRDNPIWHKLETAARGRKMMPMKSFYFDLVKEALYMRLIWQRVRRISPIITNGCTGILGSPCFFIVSCGRLMNKRNSIVEKRNCFDNVPGVRQNPASALAGRIAQKVARGFAK
jgi:hypothetical protein